MIKPSIQAGDEFNAASKVFDAHLLLLESAMICRQERAIEAARQSAHDALDRRIDAQWAFMVKYRQERDARRIREP